MYLPIKRPLYLPPSPSVCRPSAPRAIDPAVRSVSGRVTLAIALLAALITMFLWTTAHFSGSSVAPDRVPEQLGVVQVQAGETLEALANRVMPEVPSAAAIERIGELNQLQSSELQSGQTLIAPIS
jgi:hypothetical protein